MGVARLPEYPSEEHEIKRESVVPAYGIFFLSQKQQCQYEI